MSPASTDRDRRVSRLDWRGRLVLASVAAAGAATLAPKESLVRLVVMLWFLLLSPGLSLTPFLGCTEVLTELTLAVALSIGVDTGISLALLYARIWRPGLGLVALMALCLAGVGIARRRGARVTVVAAPVTSRARRIGY
ncbi:MAG: hypothetical protein M3066_11915 [Actinomycetota bacterium]|nr:hypothetical protein [Actinomycetota bacterium]